MLDFLVTHSRIAHSFAASYAMRFSSAAGEVSTEAVSERERVPAQADMQPDGCVGKDARHV